VKLRWEIFNVFDTPALAYQLPTPIHMKIPNEKREGYEYDDI
jgi:hypothetical protein